MSITSPWPFLVINAACFALAWLLLARSTFYRKLISGLDPGRAPMIDGLRGWLALGVFFQHAVNAWFFRHGAGWDGSGAPFYGTTGAAAVSLFFMITGFLFWTRVLRSQGALDAPRLYRSRVRRLAPMYLASVVLSLLVVAVLSGGHAQVGLNQLAHEIRPWLSFGFLPTGEVNGVADAHQINAVYWTLAYEWMFYLALPFLAVFARGWTVLLVFLVAIFFGTSMPIVLNFVAGALIATAAHEGWLPASLRRKELALVPLAVLAATYVVSFDHPVIEVALLAVFFLFVVGGNSLFGLLASGPARLLGTVSYSIYLLHCIVLFCLVHWIDARWPIKTMTAEAYWMLAGVIGLLTVLAAAVTYRWCEHPFLTAPERRHAPSRPEPVPNARVVTLP